MKHRLMFPPGPGAPKDRVVYEEDGLKRESSAPCQLNCPSGIDIPSFIALIGLGRFDEAVDVIRQDNPFPWVCGLVCPNPCEGWCQRRYLDKALCIKDLKAIAAKSVHESGRGYINPEPAQRYDEKVAVIGAGPAGLTCAYFLASFGYSVTIFEALPEPGGLLMYGIPEFRLPRDIVRREIAYIQDMGVEIVTNTPIGEDLTLDQLRKDGYKAFFLGIGAWDSVPMNVECDTVYPQIIDVLTFLKEVTSGIVEKPANAVAIVGGGNAAIDAARTCVRLGCMSVSILYRRTRSEMPAHFEEIIQAAEEGIHFHQLTLPQKIIGSSGKVDSVECVMTDLGQPDESGRRKPIPIPDSQYRMPVGAIVSAIGQRPHIKGYRGFEDIELTEKETIRTRPWKQQTNVPDVFAAGDAVTGPATVIEAIGGGKRAARAIHAYLRNEKMPGREQLRPRRMVEPIRMDYHEKAFIQRQEIPIIDLSSRMNSFEQVEKGLDATAAQEEAKRCMRCDVCERCGKCVDVCTEKLGISGIEFHHAGESSLILKDYVHGLPYCIGCGTCVNICPTGALQIEDEDKERKILMSGTVINRLSLVECRSCGQNYATKAVIKHVRRDTHAPDDYEGIALCPECKRLHGAAGIAGLTGNNNQD